MGMTTRTPPNDQRNFVHARIKRGLTGFVTSGFNPLTAATSFLAPAPARRAVTPPIFRVQPAGIRKEIATAIKFRVAPGVASPMASLSKKKIHQALHKAQKVALRLGLPDPGHGFHTKVESITGGRGCLPLFKRDPISGRCVPALGEQVGRDDTPIGDTVMGRYGAGEVPGNMVINRAICRRGMVLGDDNICYNRTQITNRQREWPKGRRPLLTGGDMRAISTAARAGKRLERTQKRLQKIGLMKKPAPRRQIRSGPTEHHHHTQ